MIEFSVFSYIRIRHKIFDCLDDFSVLDQRRLAFGSRSAIPVHSRQWPLAYPYQDLRNNFHAGEVFCSSCGRTLHRWTTVGNRDQSQVEIADMLQQTVECRLVGQGAGK